MKIELKKIFELLFSFLYKIWQKIIERPLKILFDFIILISAVATIIGLFLILPQTQLINDQLREINSQPIIKINFDLATSTIIFGPSSSEPVDIILTVKNDGNKVASYWRGSLVFCKNITVVNSEKPWIKEKEVDNQYLIESQKAIPPTFPGKLKFYSHTLDNLGSFRIILPNNNNLKFEKPIAIGQVTISGDYNHPVNYLVLLSYPTGFIYENLLQENGSMHENYFSKLGMCFDIIDNTKNNITVTNY